MSFEEKFEIQVAHFEPDEIIIRGSAVFPRIGFNVPQPMDEVNEEIRKQAEANVGLSKDEEMEDKLQPPGSSRFCEVGLDPVSDGEDNLSFFVTEFQMEIERLMVIKFARENFLGAATKRSSKLR